MHPGAPPAPSSYRAPFWLRGGNLQTIWAAKCMPTPTVVYRRERWTTPDDDFIDIDFADGPPGSPLVVLFHGLEGSSDSHYCRNLMHAVTARGWSGAVPHFRGCSGEINRQPRLYHSGDSTEIDWIVRRLAARHVTSTIPNVTAPRAIYLAGVSLGGNALLRWLGEQNSAAHQIGRLNQIDQIVRAACAISAPLDLAAGGAALGSGFTMLYTRIFLATMKRKAAQKLIQYPGLFDRRAMLAARDLYEFDNIVTAPLHGYRDTDDYWRRASSKPILSDIALPTLVLNARNDPFLPGRHLPERASESVTLDFPEHGGHVGFVSGPFPGNQRWLANRVLDFFSQHGNAT